MSTFARQAPLFVGVIALLFSLTACDNSSGEDNTPPEDFAATINGSTSFEGSAFAIESHGPLQGEVSWGITMSDSDTNQGYRILVAWEAARPSNGSYPISDTDPAAFEVLVTFEDLLDQYHGKSGTVTITSSSDSEVRGRLNFSADYNGFETGSMGSTISGDVTFTANNIVDNN